MEATTMGQKSICRMTNGKKIKGYALGVQLVKKPVTNSYKRYDTRRNGQPPKSHIVINFGYFYVSG
jgi:hypothetical protein